MTIVKGQRILCLCQKGNSRSVALAWMLKKRGADALSAGLVTSSPETIRMLCDWAETVILTDKRLLSLVPAGRWEIKVWDVGTDRWFAGFRPDLVSRFETYMQECP